MSLPLTTVERIFSRLMASYGRQFADLYADIDPTDVKAQWAHELDAFSSPVGLKRIAWALDNLPGKAPNAPEFRNLCKQAHVDLPPQLPMGDADPEKVREVVRRLAPVLGAQSPSKKDPKGWARKLIAKSERGESVRAISLRFAREALRMNLAEVTE